MVALLSGLGVLCGLDDPDCLFYMKEIQNKTEEIAKQRICKIF
jgi:hypothetical protein